MDIREGIKGQDHFPDIAMYPVLGWHPAKVKASGLVIR